MKQERGFAILPPDQQRAIARRGGIAAHVKGTAHEWKSGAEAADAGQKGGLATRDRRREREAAAAPPLPATADV